MPLVSLWFPFQIMGDIWRAGLPDPERAKTAWLPALWWTCWLIGGVGMKAPAPDLSAQIAPASLVVLAVAAVTLLAIIRKVSNGPVGSPLPAQRVEAAHE